MYAAPRQMPASRHAADAVIAGRFAAARPHASPGTPTLSALHMTPVIGPRAVTAYAHPMHPSSALSALAVLLAEQRAIEARIHDRTPCPEEALIVGDALLAFASREDRAFSALAPLLDPAAQQELAAEHQRIAEDLTLLDWLVRTTPDSSDVIVLTTSLVQRMRQHIERDGRLLARAAGLASWR